MNWLLQKALGTLIHRGTLHVTTASGSKFTVGDGTGEPIAMRFTRWTAQLGVLLDPELKTGEAYMDGTLVIEKGSIAGLLALAMSQDRGRVPLRGARLQWGIRYLLRTLKQLNGRRRSKRNVAHHYDLDGEMYSLFLDADRQYSCAYFESPGRSLDDAQLAKKRHLAAKLLLRRGDRVLDIGSGWGGLGLYLARTAGAQVTGVTLSEEQLVHARGRAEAQGLTNRAEFRLQDYRDVAGRFDRIVSVGMFEHIGVQYYDTFFRKCASLLAEDGVFLLHSIGRSDGPGVTNPWIAKYIFPGGYIPALSEVLPVIERAGLLITDIEILRLHYAETLKAWRERFLAQANDVKRIYDERFLRMWEFYLASSEMSFREQGLMVLQIQMAKRQDTVPITRGYIADEEKRLSLEQRHLKTA